MDPAVAAADRALASGSADQLVHTMEGEVATGIRQRFERALRARKSADSSVAAGREYVEAYVDFVHYVEGLKGGGHEESAH